VAVAVAVAVATATATATAVAPMATQGGPARLPAPSPWRRARPAARWAGGRLGSASKRPGEERERERERESSVANLIKPARRGSHRRSNPIQSASARSLARRLPSPSPSPSRKLYSLSARRELQAAREGGAGGLYLFLGLGSTLACALFSPSISPQAGSGPCARDAR